MQDLGNALDHSLSKEVRENNEKQQEQFKKDERNNMNLYEAIAHDFSQNLDNKGWEEMINELKNLYDNLPSGMPENQAKMAITALGDAIKGLGGQSVNPKDYKAILSNYQGQNDLLDSLIRNITT
jgi:translation initiation factor 2 alpha subunit (eIF-2alpha)